jgi:hypothetical protein
MKAPKQKAKTMKKIANSGKSNTPVGAGQLAESAKSLVVPRPLSELLSAVREILCRYVSFQFPEQPAAIALWVVHTWVLDAFDYTPYLHIYSAETSSGKSRLLEVLAYW